MRRTLTIVGLALLLGAGLLAPTPGLAAFGALVEIPADPLYSPFGGPATVTFTFEPGDAATIFTIRLRRPGHGTIREKGVLVDPGTMTSPHEVSFGWADLNVARPTDYVVDVRRQNGTVLHGQTFTVLPPLVSDLSATPSPFYPIIDDGFKDHTTIGFSLAADTTDTELRVHVPDVYGRCCGAAIRTVDLGALAEGAHTWQWDGTRDDLSMATKGTFFVRIEATDTDDVTMTSKAQAVELTSGFIRLTATKEKYGSAYARVFDERQTAIGGDCNVSKDRYTHLASVLCANAGVSIEWRWALDQGERVEKASFVIDGGYYGCHKRVDHTKRTSILKVVGPYTSTCTISLAKITYSYPVAA